MALVINTNMSSLIAQKALSKTQETLQNSFNRLSSGYRINSAADDAAGLGMSESQNQEIRNISAVGRPNDAPSQATEVVTSPVTDRVTISDEGRDRSRERK